ncbi:hypothetical protein BOO25_00600 [Vibrio navarrensis]|uniref:hypothetical protein n=1 Tax=Vibrio navarrensis TaxID=29495 RepID=UPI00192FA4A2|nr:hypothetical protein [Vibrio navarrensis]MBE3667445.1 hypothetical protein [Vibrio navarrensis]
MSMKNDHYNVLMEYLSKSVKPALLNIKVVSYLFVSVLLIGGAGVWMPWIRSTGFSAWLPGSTVFTYVFALLGTMLCNRLYFYTSQLKEVKQMIREKREPEDIDNTFLEFEKHSVLSAWGIMVGAIILLLVSFSYSYFYNQDSWIGWLGFLMALCLYFVSSVSDVQDKTKIEDVKDKQEAEPIIPNDSDQGVELDANFFQTGEL